MNTAERLKLLFFAIFSRTRDMLNGSATMEEITRIAKSVLQTMTVDDAPFDWDDATPLSVGAARWQENVKRPVRLIGHVSEVHDPAVIKVPLSEGEYEYIETTAAKIMGVDGEEIHTLDVVGRSLIERVQAACRSGTLVECLGFVVVLPVRINAKRPDKDLGIAGHFFFHLVDLRDSSSAFDLLAATADERDQARALLALLRTDGKSPFDFMRDTVTKELAIVASDKAPHLATGMEFVILQALSDGRVGNAPGRLHVIIVGPPGQGKKLFQLAGRALNPVCQEASAAKCSPAGLIGASHRTAEGWRSTPGLLPLASSGVLCIQDAHGWNRHRMAQFGPILQELMEDGEVRDAVAGGRKRSANTSLLIDLNRHAQLQLGNKAVASEAPLLTLLPLLSRFDAIIEIPVDAPRAWAVGERMYAGFGQNSKPFDHEGWVRSVRLLVAALRDEHRTIDTSQVLPLLEATHRDIRVEQSDLIASSPVEASAIPVRMAVSMTRMVLASARAHDRSYAVEADVQRASGFMRKKLSFLRSLAQSPNVQMSGSPNVRSAAREAYYREAWAGRETRPQDVARAYADESGTVVSEKTVARDFERLGAVRVRHGVWLLPGANEGGALS
jgi:hypothetical protein